MNKFLILSLPRSRSAWLAHFLRYSGRVVTHDLAVECGSVEEFLQRFGMVDGSCETGAVLGWKLLRAAMPETKLVVVRRDPREVGMSLREKGVPPHWEDLFIRSALLEQLGAEPGVVTVEYSALADPLVCKALFEHCLELPFDWQWWGYYNSINIQVNMQERVDRLHENFPKLEAFKAEVAERTRELPGAMSCLN